MSRSHRLPGAFIALLPLAVVGLSCAAAETPAPAGVIAQLEAMNDADCATSKAADWASFAKTLAPEFVAIDVIGKRQSREELLADLRASTPDARVTGCSTRVDRVTKNGDRYLLQGDYTEEGTQGPAHARYRTLSRIRDTWKRSATGWLQTESLTCEMTVWIDGKQVEHRVLPAPR